MITFMNLTLSGPSVIEPSAIKEEYLFFQSVSFILALANCKTGSMISLPITRAIALRQHPEDNATPNSSSSSSSSSMFTFWMH
jgi:hypothetical protein